MKTCEIKDAFGIDALKFSERPGPPLQHGQVRIRVRAVSLNYRDLVTVKHGGVRTVRFAEKLARKDTGLATDLAREFNVPLRIGHLVEEEHVEAMARGWGERDATVPFALQEERAGVKMRTTKA